MSTIFNNINWIAVIIAAFAYFILGALWYSKILFAKRWIHYTGVDASNPDATKGMAAIMTASFVMMLLTCFGLSILKTRLDLHVWQSGVKLGLVTGLLFGVAAISISYLYEKRPTALHFINGGYTLLGNIIAAIIICVMD